jgi:hypothetical protein
VSKSIPAHRRAGCPLAEKKEPGRGIRLKSAYPWAMAPTITITKPVATAIATFVSIDKFIIFPFNYGGNPPSPLFLDLIFSVASNFGVLMDAKRRRRKNYESKKSRN